ncbi:MAG: hypothetical protein H0X16_06860 [Chloroflexi bacterium]|nr:hypothetical protein [Chloroflexota bacterium]
MAQQSTAKSCSHPQHSPSRVADLFLFRRLSEEREVARYKHIAVKKIDLADLVPKPKERKPTPRQIAQQERDGEIRAALNEAASLPSSQAVVIDMKEDQKLPTMRASIGRVLKAEPRELNWGVRGQSIVISKGKIPGRGRAHW